MNRTHYPEPRGRLTRRTVRSLIACAAAVALLVACQAAAAASVQVTQANAVFPQRALVVSGSGLGGLSAQRVHIIENGASVRSIVVRSLKQPSAHDFGVVLVIDVSPNASAIEHAVAAARGLAAERPSRELLGIVEADAFPPVALALTSDPTLIDTALASVPTISRHGLHVYDAALTGLGMLRAARIAAGSVIVLSDGADHGDPATLQQLASIAAAGHVRIFAVGITSPRFDPRALTNLAQVSGGQFVTAGSGQLSQVFGAIQTRLVSQYLIRYYSSQSAGRRIPASMTIDGVPGVFDITYSTPSLPPGVVTSPIPPKHRSIWTSTLGALLVSLICAALIGIAVLLAIRERQDIRARIGGFVGHALPRASKPRTLVQRALGDPRLRRPQRSPWLDALALELELARLNISPLAFVLLTLVGTGVLAWLVAVTTSSPIAAFAALGVPVAARMAVGFLAARQRREFDEQLPDNLQVIASALRAGHTFIGALGVMVEDAPEPSRRELRRALADEQLGVPLADTLRRVGTRMKSLEFHQVTLVATLQRDTGGNTAEVLDVVTDAIRDRLDLRRLIRTLTAQGRFAGLILSGLPIILLLAISFINPGYEHPLFHTTAGVFAFALAIIMVISGSLIIRRIVNIEI